MLAITRADRLAVEQASNQATAHDNLPCQLSSFVGRTRELDELQRLLDQVRLLTLVGPGGVGKTRLALEVAARFVPLLNDGVWLVELGSLTDPVLVAQRIAATFGISERAEGSSLARLTDILGRRQLLLVLDNCEHLVEVSARVAEALLQSCPRLRVLATSREPLGISGEQLWPVAPLSLPHDASALDSESVQLFVERAVASQPGFCLSDANRHSIFEICARLDGIPLAIELAAARVKTLTADQIAARLDDRLRLLVSGSHTVPPRQQTLEATLTWSYGLLTRSDQRLFDRLAVFSGNWSLEAAEVVCADLDLAAEDVLSGLERLVERSLVLAEQGRYRLLETVRQYAEQQLLRTGGFDARRERHAQYYLHLAETAEPQLKRVEQATWFERLAVEHDNLRAALRWSVNVGEPELGLRLATALARFWEVRGHWTEARRWFAELFSVPGSTDLPSSLRAGAIAQAGFIAHSQGDNAAGRPLLEEALTLARAAKARSTEAFALYGLAQMANWQGDNATARRLLLDSLALARQLNDGWATARVLANLGNVAREERDIELARSLLEEGLAIAQRAGERRIESTLQGGLAGLAQQSADLEAATSYAVAGLATKRELGDRFGAAMLARTLGWVAFDRRDYVMACEHFLEVVSIARDLGVFEPAPSALAGLACVAIQLGEPNGAMRMFAAAARAAESAGMPSAAYPSERRRPLLEAAWQSLGTAAERLWSEGWTLQSEGIEAEARAVARVAMDASMAAVDGARR